LLVPGPVRFSLTIKLLFALPVAGILLSADRADDGLVTSITDADKNSVPYHQEWRFNDKGELMGIIENPANPL
jgi:hypothetical protein